MPFDGFVMAAVAAELREKILGGRILKIYQPESNMVIIRLRREKDNLQLLMSAHPVTGRLHLTTEAKENPLQAPLFCMVLRKHLEGGRIIGIEQAELERVLKIRVEAFDELGEKSEKILVVEIMGKHSNIILLDPRENEILDGIRRYTHLVSRYREVLPGRPYLAPPSQGKADPLMVNEESFRERLLSLPLNTHPAKAILKNFSGFSPLLAAEVAVRAELPGDALLDDLGDYELIRLWQGFQSIVGAARDNAFQPTVIMDGMTPADFSCLSLVQFTAEAHRSFDGISEALDFFFTRRGKEELFLARQRELEKIVRVESEKLAKKYALQQADLEGTAGANTYRLYGELITAQMYRLSRGMEKASLENFYDGTLLEVPLDSRWTPVENAQYYFKKYNKAKSSRVLIEEQMKKTGEEIAYLESVLAALEQSKGLADLSEIRSELVEAGYLKEKNLPKGKKKDETLSQPLTFLSSEGFTIMVGKNNKQNDRLTLKMAAKDDIWLHTKNIPGSHVIIRQKAGAEIPFSTIQQAAKIAAFYSRAQSSSQVPVDYTLVKQVKKPNGAKPGMVIYFEQQTLYVTPELVSPPAMGEQ